MILQEEDAGRMILTRLAVSKVGDVAQETSGECGLEGWIVIKV